MPVCVPVCVCACVPVCLFAYMFAYLGAYFFLPALFTLFLYISYVNLLNEFFFFYLHLRLRNLSYIKLKL